MNSNESLTPSSGGRVFPWSVNVFPTALMALIAYIAQGVVAGSISSLFEGTGDIGESIGMAVGFAVSFAAAIFLFTRVTDHSYKPGAWAAGLRSYGAVRPRLTWSQVVGKAFLLWVLVAVTIMVVAPFLPNPYSPAGEIGKKLDGTAFAIFALSTVILAPLFEEVFFRGLIQNAMASAFFKELEITKRTADNIAVFLTAAAFALAHGTATGFPYLFILGLGFGEVYRLTGDIRTSMVMHAINNAVATLVLANQS